MSFLFAMIFLSMSAALLGAVLGMAHGVEVERKRWKLKPTEPVEIKDEKDSTFVTGAVWRS